jgi:hypothetical protein
MRIAGRGNIIGIALGGLALVVASTGTAVAVTATHTQIVDANTPTNVARVDESGRLAVGTPKASFNSAYFTGLGLSAMTSPTTATLAVTRVSEMSNSGNASVANANFLVSLVQVAPDSDGACYTGSVRTSLSIDPLPPGAHVEDTYTAPLVFKPLPGNKPYCIGVSVSAQTGTAPGSYYIPYVQVTGYVVNGSYTGQGVLGATGASMSPLVTPSTPRPDGMAPAL